MQWFDSVNEGAAANYSESEMRTIASAAASQNEATSSDNGPKTASRSDCGRKFGAELRCSLTNLLMFLGDSILLTLRRKTEMGRNLLFLNLIKIPLFDFKEKRTRSSHLRQRRLTFIKVQVSKIVS